MKGMQWIAPVLCLGPAIASAQVQETTFGDPVTVDSSAFVAVESIEVSHAGSYDVALTAHVYGELVGSDGGRYRIGICAGSTSGPQVGSALWRPGNRTPARSTYESDTTTITGFAANVTGPATFVLCASKFDSGSPDLTLYPRGLNAVTAPAGTSLAGSQVTDFGSNIDVTTTSGVALGSVTVDAGAGSDVLLTAHARLEAAGLGDGNRYEIDLRRGSPSGPLVGRGFWRAARSAGTFQADSIAVTGFDAGVTGSTTYFLTGFKFDAGAPDAIVSLRGLHAVVAAADATLFGTQQLTATPSTVLGSSAAALASLTVDGGTEVRLTGQAYLEGSALGGHRYTLGICRDDANGPLVGSAYWRPNTQTTDSSFVGDTIAVTGYDSGLSGPTTYVLCARDFDGAPPTVTAYNRGLVAQVPEPDTALGLVAGGALAALRSRRTRSGRRRTRAGTATVKLR